MSKPEKGQPIRFLLFAGNRYYPRGGLLDLVGGFASLAEAEARRQALEAETDWDEIGEITPTGLQNVQRREWRTGAAVAPGPWFYATRDQVRGCVDEQPTALHCAELLLPDGAQPTITHPAEDLFVVRGGGMEVLVYTEGAARTHHLKTKVRA